MKKFFIYILLSLLVHVSFSQEIPKTIRTEYLQVFIGGRDGTSTANDVAKGCAVFIIDNENNIIEMDCSSQRILSKIKLVTSEATKYFPNGWSKRYCGYDPNNFTYGLDGSINLTDYYTIIFKANKYEVFTEVVGSNVSLATRFFNL